LGTYLLGYLFATIKVYLYNGAFTLDVKSMLNENLGGILGSTQHYMADSLMLIVEVNVSLIIKSAL
jgi:hypothetical protein